MVPGYLMENYQNLIPKQSLSIYLDQLLSSHHIASIIQITEALRLGTLIFPSKELSFSSLPRPFIGLVRSQGAHSICDFPFPKTFTLVIGNEELGLSKEILAECDHLVDCSYAIAAGMIRHLLNEI